MQLYRGTRVLDLPYQSPDYIFPEIITGMWICMKRSRKYLSEYQFHCRDVTWSSVCDTEMSPDLSRITGFVSKIWIRGEDK